MTNKNIYNDYYLVDLVNRTKFYNSSNYSNFKEYRCKCPICEQEGYVKNSLSIKSDFSIGRCFRCDSVFVNAYDPLTNEFSKKVSYPTSKNYSLCKLDKTEEYTKLSGLTRTGLDYLKNRNEKMMVDKYKLRSTEKFIIVPFFFKGELIYYQKRFISSSSFLKHYKPPIDNQPFYLINNESKHLVICEGAFDSFACDNIFNEKYDVVALCGKAMSHYQLWLLSKVRVYESITIFLDETKLSEELYKNIKDKFIINPEFHIVKSNGDDPEEMFVNNIQLEYL